jgi:F0F1-type ATP synthase membrane subunit a
MIAGSLLLAMILMMMGNLTKNWLAGREVPLLIPLIFYLQSTLTAVVQAFAFSLLTSVFIKVALDDSPPEKKNLKETPVHQQLVQSIQR